MASKAVAGLAAAAIVTAGAVEVKHAAKPRGEKAAVVAQAPDVATAPAPTPVPTSPPVVTVASAPQTDAVKRTEDKEERAEKTEKAEPTATPTATATTTPTPAPTEARGGDTTALPTDTQGTAEPGSGSYTPSQPPPSQSGPVLAAVQPAEPQPQPSAEPVGDARGDADHRSAPGRDSDALADADAHADPAGRHADADRGHAAGRRPAAAAGLVNPSAERDVRVRREEDDAALLVGRAEHEHL